MQFVLILIDFCIGLLEIDCILLIYTCQNIQCINWLIWFDRLKVLQRRRKGLNSKWSNKNEILHLIFLYSNYKI
jgi:hypothetical protein